MSTLKVTNIQATGETASRAVSGVAAAWANVNGTGTISTRNSLNVSSLTDNSTGDFTINFNSAFSAADYAATGMGGNASNAGIDFYAPWMQSPAVSNFRVGVFNGNGSTAKDNEYDFVTFHGDLA